MRWTPHLCLALMALALHLVWAPDRAMAAPGSRNAEVRLSTNAAARAEAASGPVLGVDPVTHDFGRQNVGGSSGPFEFTVRNTGDADLTITALAHSNPVAGFSASMALPVTLAPGATAPLSISFAPTGSGHVIDVLSFTSNSTGGFPVLLQGVGNTAPLFDPALQSDYSATAFVPFSLTAGATDAEGDAIVWSLESVPPLPVGATFDTVSGALNWTLDPADAGDYAVTITIDDGLAHTVGHFTLHALVTNRPPTANPGDDYKGLTGVPLVLDGTGSSDPDPGQALTFAWDFGDGTQGTGPTPSHAYPSPGVYFAALTVTDDGTPPFSDTKIAGVTIVTLIDLTIVQPTKDPPLIKTNGNGEQKFGIEANSDLILSLDPSTIKISTTYPHAGSVSEVALPQDRTLRIADINDNTIGDLDIPVRAQWIKPLLSHVANGTRVTLVFRAVTLGEKPVPMMGSIDLIKSSTGKTATLGAAPNPFRPGTAIQVSVREAGPMAVRIFSADGRLVRTLMDETRAEPGDHEVRWNALDEQGRRVRSGIYFVKAITPGETSVLKLVVMR